jgi:hypothetical protein
MKDIKLLVMVTVLMVGIVIAPGLIHAQESWVKKLAYRYKEAIANIQNFCIEKAKVECELLEMEQNPPLLLEGQVIDYIGVRQRGVVYFYLVVAEKEDMDPDIYLFDSRGRLLKSEGGDAVGSVDLAVHVPEYTQKVTHRIKMFKGSGHIAVAILAPVGGN